MMNIRILTALTAISLLACAAAVAVPVQYDFTATLQGTGSSTVGSQFALGDTVTGSLTYDTAATDSFSATTRGIYSGQPTAFSFTVTTASGPQAYTSTSNTIDVNIGNPAFDEVSFRSFAVAGPALSNNTLATPNFVNLFWRDATRPLANDSLSANLLSTLTVAPTFLLNFDPNRGGDGTYNLRFQFTSLTSNSVAEPTVLLLVAFGCVLVGIQRRRVG